MSMFCETWDLRRPQRKASTTKDTKEHEGIRFLPSFLFLPVLGGFQLLAAKKKYGRGKNGD
jgi:hypothetical protein